MKKSVIKKAISVFLSVMVALMAIFVGYLVLCNINGRVAFVGRHSTVKIVSPSMEPTISVGTYIIVEKVNPADIEVGDILLFISRDPAIYGKGNTHRVVQIIEDASGRSFITKGDHNDVNDKLSVPASDVVGRYVRSSLLLTRVAGWFSHPLVFLIGIGIPALALLIMSIWDVIKKSKEVKMDLMVQEELRRLKEQAEQENDDGSKQ